ncbi:MAG: transporter substrate-binding domain-containing protein [Oscillospiraceae bacterium]
MVAAGMTATDERKQSVNFTTDYYESTQAILVQK